MGKLKIIIINILVLIIGIALSVAYSNHLTDERTILSRDAFKSTVETMVQVSMQQLNIQQEHVSNWCNYINEGNMTLEEAMEFLGKICTDEGTEAQIINPKTLTGQSIRENVMRKGDYAVSYEIYSDDLINSFLEMMEKSDSDNYLCVTGAFSNQTNGMQVVAFGKKVMLRTESEKRQEYLLLRLIYLDKFREQWIFPTEYENAEISLITLEGDYIVQSSSMKSENFYEFIRAYNNLTYPQKDALQALMNDTNSGVLKYCNARGVDSYWVYAGLQENFGNWMIIGYIPVDSLDNNDTDWALIFMVAGILLVLFLIDGMYFMLMNQKLRLSMEEAKEANQAKTRFLSSMSHDIRTPMNAIIGMTTIAKSQINDPKRIKDCLDKITVASNHLLTLINDVLDISRVESGKLVLNPTVFSLSEMLENLQNILRSQIAAKDLDFRICRIHLVQDYLYADDLRLNQIFINILSNAVKYTPQGGRVTMTVQEEPIEENKVRLIYIVEDTGIGMDEEFLKTIFEPFTRVKDSRIDTVEGSGLGMAIVKQMLDAMGGEISVKSKLGEGSVFSVKIDLSVVGKPVEENLQKMLKEKHSNTDSKSLSEKNLNENAISKQEESKKVTTDEKSTAKDSSFGTKCAGMHLLIAEDNDMNWEIIHELLSYCDITSERAENGQVCVQMLKKAPHGTYHAILMDIQMPIMNGREATRTIRALDDDKIRNIPIIAMTADAFVEDVRAGLEAGMNGYIAKPIDMKLLMQELGKIITTEEDI